MSVDFERRRRHRDMAGMLGIGLGTFVVAVLFVFSGSGMSLPFGGPKTDRVAGSSAETSPGATSTSPPSATQQLTTRVQVALAQDRWPALDPSPTALGARAAVTPWSQDGCLDVTTRVVENRCVYGNPAGTRLAVLVGDSLAISWLPALEAALGSDWRIQVLTLGQCPAVDISVTRPQDGSAFTPACDAHHALESREITRLHPQLVIMSSGVDNLTRLASGAKGGTAYAQWLSATQATVAGYAQVVPRVVVLQPPPPGADLAACWTPVSRPRNCLGSPTADSIGMGAAEKTAVTSVSGFGTVTYVPTSGWFCVLGRCPAFVGNTPVFADGTNLTQAFSVQLAPVVASVVLPRSR